MDLTQLLQRKSKLSQLPVLEPNKRQDTGRYGQGMHSICPTFGVAALAWIYTGVGYDTRHYKMGCEMSSKYPQICLKDKPKFENSMDQYCGIGQANQQSKVANSNYGLLNFVSNERA